MKSFPQLLVLTIVVVGVVSFLGVSRPSHAAPGEPPPACQSCICKESDAVRLLANNFPAPPTAVYRGLRQEQGDNLTVVAITSWSNPVYAGLCDPDYTRNGDTLPVYTYDSVPVLCQDNGTAQPVVCSVPTDYAIFVNFFATRQQQFCGD
jgi:hypothetical protein